MVARPDRPVLLLLCTGNSCRSQIAEGWARALAAPGVEVWSAGTHPVGVNPRAEQVMAEVGIDLREQSSKGVDEVPLERVTHVVTLCGEAESRCSHLAIAARREHWPVDDPFRTFGTERAVLEAFRKTREEVRKRMEEYLAREGLGAGGAGTPLIS